MSNKLTSIRINFVKRTAAKNGPALSDLLNDGFAELSIDLVGLQEQWNTYLIPLISTLPYGSATDGDDLVDAFTDGLDGKTIYVDSDTVQLGTGVNFYNAAHARPNTIKDQFDSMYLHISDIEDELRDELAEISGGISSSAKVRIGANIFDSTLVSSSLSLDGLTAANKQNLIQLANDLYDADSEYAMNGSGDPILTFSVKDSVDALLQLHNGLWNSDITLSHSGEVAFSDITGQATQAQVDNSVSYDSDYTGSPSNLQDDLNQIRTTIKDISGAASWTAPVLDWDSNQVGLQDVADWSGTAPTKSSTNPWGMNYADLDGDYTDVYLLSGVLTASQDYVGRTSLTDDTPSYSSATIIGATDDLTTAIGSLDAGVNAHTTNTSNPHSVTLTQAETAGGSIDSASVSVFSDSYSASNASEAFDEVMIKAMENTSLIEDLSNNLDTDIFTLSGQISSLDSDLTTHTTNYSNPHQVTGAQIGYSGIVTEVNDGDYVFSGHVLPTDVVFDFDLLDHKKGAYGTAPSYEHWAGSIDCSDVSPVTTASGLTGSALSDVLSYTLTSTSFRRYEYEYTSWGNGNDIIIGHDRSMYPLAQVIEYDYSVCDGYGDMVPDISITHSGLNDIILTNDSGGELASGLIVLLF